MSKRKRQRERENISSFQVLFSWKLRLKIRTTTRYSIPIFIVVSKNDTCRILLFLRYMLVSNWSNCTIIFERSKFDLSIDLKSCRIDVFFQSQIYRGNLNQHFPSKRYLRKTKQYVSVLQFFIFAIISEKMKMIFGVLGGMLHILYITRKHRSRRI